MVTHKGKQGIIFDMSDDIKTIFALRELSDSAKAQSFFQSLGFIDWKAAWAILRQIDARAHQGLAGIFSHLMTALGSAADPDRSLVNFDRFIKSNGPDAINRLAVTPRVIEILVTLFSTSPFLTEIILRTPDALDLLTQRAALTERKTIEQYQNEAVTAYQPIESDIEKLNALRLYQRRQLLRIGTCDFLDLYDLRAVFSQLSRMAIGLVRACLTLASQQMGTKPTNFVVLAMGKLGGWELNYSSDIDLLFLAKEKSDEYNRLGVQLIENISKITPEGFLYRVDMRLRPWGIDGPLITTLKSHFQYIQKHARLWEKQALLKARPIAGNLALGEELRRKIEPYLFRAPPEEVRASVFAMKQRTEEFLKEKGRDWGEVKLGVGSIRDIEFVVQSLQMSHPTIRTRATLKAIPRLREEGWLSASEARVLTDGYIFLRTIEHYLQMIDYRQTYTLPSDPNAIGLLARRLGFEGDDAGGNFIKQYEQYCKALRAIFLKYVGNENGDSLDFRQIPPMVREHISRMDTSYTATFSQAEISRHADLIAGITPDSLIVIDPEAVGDGRWRVTIVGYDYLGEISLICGLMFVYGMNILESYAFTYEPTERGDSSPAVGGDRLKIVDVFVVRSVGPNEPTPELWERYGQDLSRLLSRMQAGQRRETRGELAKMVGNTFHGQPAAIVPLYPIDIEIDNKTSSLYTVLKIDAPDTVGFLYEFTNALAINHINIARMDIHSVGNRVKDTFYVTDEHGNKIISPERQRELRAATVLIKHFTHLLPHSANPESALLHFRDFLSQLFKRPNWPDEFARLERPEFLDALVQSMGMSDFLWDDFLRMQYANLFPVVQDVDALAARKSQQKLTDELESEFSRTKDWREALNSFKDREMFRIDMRHILGYTSEFWDFAYELTDLAELVVETAFQRCLGELEGQFGIPRLEDGNSCPVTLFALGKYGGRELGFASDIELMFIYAGKGRTTGPKIVSTSEFYEELIHSFVYSIHARLEGIFHIDLQLRPYGKAGSLAVMLDAFQRYYAPDGPAWAYERQALVKLRPIAGGRALGEQVCRLRDRFVYNGEPFDVTAMQAMRERQIRHLVTAGTFNAKYSPGGLVDVEYLVQALQITHGAANPALRLANIRMAMAALAKAKVLSEDDYACLRKAHTFLRWLIDALRVVRGNTKDVNIPAFESEEFAFLARRLRYGSDTERLREDLTRFPLDVQELSLRLLSIQ